MSLHPEHAALVSAARTLVEMVASGDVRIESAPQASAQAAKQAGERFARAWNILAAAAGMPELVGAQIELEAD